jgi:hypothetical protein
MPILPLHAVIRQHVARPLDTEISDFAGLMLFSIILIILLGL